MDISPVGLDHHTSPIPNTQYPIPVRHSLFAILLLAFLLRFYCLTCSSYWHDEGNTWALVQRSFAQIAVAAAADIHPPGYYWLLKVWSLVFGYSPWALRAFSALTGTLTVAVVYAIGKIVISDQSSVISPESSATQSPISNTQSPAASRQSPVANRQYPIPFFPLLAALLAALNPFQIFYSQEARMYSLLMLESAGLVWVGLQVAGGRSQVAGDRSPVASRQSPTRHSQFTIHNSPFTILFALLAAAGLWTHYIFPVVLAAVGVAVLWNHRRGLYAIRNTQYASSATVAFLAANALALLLFLPWLSTAIDRVLSWPAGGVNVTALDGLRLTLQTLAVGPIRSGPQLAWPWLVLVGLLPLIGLWRLRRSAVAPILALWLLAPIGLMFGLGLFTDSFLKFLLVASPAWCILTAYSILRIPYFVGRGRNDARRDAEAQRRGVEITNDAASSKERSKSLYPSRFTFHVSRFTFHASRVATYAIRNTQYALPLAALALAYIVLPAYYADPAARDNYARMAATVAGLGDPAADAVILNAPGQTDVWRIYDPGLPVLALPQQRPPDRATTERQLAAAVANRRQLFALFWATEQADPQGIVEGWLNRNAFKGLESWQGNVRFVHYSLPNRLTCEAFTPPARFGETIQLTRVCLPPERTVIAGTSLPIALHWQTDAPITRRYKATVQLLNPQNQAVGQQDGEPGGGSLPTDGWLPGVEVVDKQGIYAPPGAPPIAYRLILALYDAETGQRLSVGGGDALALGAVHVSRPTHPLPTAIVPMRTRLDRSIGPVVLVGFDAYAKGFAHDPARPLSPGDLLHLTLYWQTPSPLPADWPDDLTFTLTLGGEQITAPLAGAGFPTAAWQAGDFVRGDVDISYSGDGPLLLALGEAQVRLGRIANGRLLR